MLLWVMWGWIALFGAGTSKDSGAAALGRARRRASYFRRSLVFEHGGTRVVMKVPVRSGMNGAETREAN